MYIVLYVYYVFIIHDLNQMKMSKAYMYVERVSLVLTSLTRSFVFTKGIIPYCRIYLWKPKVLMRLLDYEVFSTIILSLPLIQEGQLSFSGERMYTILVNGLED